MSATQPIQVLTCDICGEKFEAEMAGRYGRYSGADRSFAINDGDDVSFETICWDCEKALLQAVTVEVKELKKKK